MYNNKIIAKRVACYNQHAAFSAKSLERMVLAMTIFEELGITYEERVGLFYPNISMATENVNVGKYGFLWMEYMKENAPDRYRNLLRFGRLKKKALEVNEEAYEMLESIEMKYLAKHKPVNSASTMEMWKLREQARMVAEEEVLLTVVYHYC